MDELIAVLYALAPRKGNWVRGWIAVATAVAVLILIVHDQTTCTGAGQCFV